MNGERIRIMYVIGSLGNGRAGTERNLLTIIDHLDRSRFEPYLVSLQDCEYIQRGQFNCDTECLQLYRMFTAPMWRKRAALAERLRTLKIDIVQTFFVEGHLVGGGAARKAGIKAIISSRRNLGYSYTAKEKLLLRFANRYPTRFLANSQAVADAISKLERVDRGKFDVIYNGVAIPPAGDRRPVAMSDKTVAMVANLRPVKAVDLLIRAAEVIVKQIPDAHFLVVGDGPQRQWLEALVGQLGLKEKVSFTGSISETQPILRSAAVGVLTSTSEGFSNAILEYMCAALPVVATAVGGNRESVVDGETGYLVPVGDVDALAAKLLQLLGDFQLARRLGNNGRARAEKTFSLEAMIRNHQEYYQKLLE